MTVSGNKTGAPRQCAFEVDALPAEAQRVSSGRHTWDLGGTGSDGPRVVLDWQRQRHGPELVRGAAIEAGAGELGREFLEDPAFGFDGEEDRHQAAYQGNGCEDGEHQADSVVVHDPADQDGADGGACPEPGAAEARADGAEPGRVQLGGVEVEREGDGLQDGVGDAGEYYDLCRRHGAEGCEDDKRDGRGQEGECVPTFTAYAVDEQRAEDGGHNT